MKLVMIAFVRFCANCVPACMQERGRRSSAAFMLGWHFTCTLYHIGGGINGYFLMKKREVRQSHLRIPRFLPKNRSGQMLFHRSGSGKVTISRASRCVIVAFHSVFSGWLC